MTDPTAVAAPVADPVTTNSEVRAGVAPAPAATDSLTITKADLSALLKEAVTAGQAQGQVIASTPRPAVDAEKPDDWTLRELFHALLSSIVLHDERKVRNAYAAVDKYYPAESVETPAVGA